MLFIVKHKVKSFKRSILLNKKIIEFITVIVSLFFLWMQLVYIALTFPRIIDYLFPSEKSFVFYCKFVLLIYFGIDFFTRLIFSKNIYIKKFYLCLNIRRDKLIISELFIKNINFNNATYLVFFVPFSISTILPNFGFNTSIELLIFIILLALFSTNIILLIKIYLLRFPLIKLILCSIPFFFFVQIIRDSSIYLFESIVLKILKMEIDILLYLVIAIFLIFFFSYKSIRSMIYIDCGY